MTLDNCIGLCNELVEYGNDLNNQLLKIKKKNSIKINRPTFDTPAAIELMPDAADYENWMGMFGIKKPS